MGLQIDPNHNNAVDLAKPLDIGKLEGLLKFDLPTCILKYRKITRSTNDDAKQAVKQGVKGIYLFVADQQTDGRGRRGRKWQTPTNSSLAISLMITQAEHFDSGILAQAAAVGLVKGLSQPYSVNVHIKWPNDAIINGKKVGGALVEQVDGALIVGLGANLNADPKVINRLYYPATSLASEIGKPIDRELVICSVASSLIDAISDIDKDPDHLLDNYVNLSTLIGKQVTIETNHKLKRGIVKTFTSNGSIVIIEQGTKRTLELASGTLKVDSA